MCTQLTGKPGAGARAQLFVVVKPRLWSQGKFLDAVPISNPSSKSQYKEVGDNQGREMDLSLIDLDDFPTALLPELLAWAGKVFGEERYFFGHRHFSQSAWISSLFLEVLSCYEFLGTELDIRIYGRFLKIMPFLQG